jgi:hypothetical protein
MRVVGDFFFFFAPIKLLSPSTPLELIWAGLGRNVSSTWFVRSSLGWARREGDNCLNFFTLMGRQFYWEIAACPVTHLRFGHRIRSIVSPCLSASWSGRVRRLLPASFPPRTHTVHPRVVVKAWHGAGRGGVPFHLTISDQRILDMPKARRWWSEAGWKHGGEGSNLCCESAARTYLYRFSSKAKAKAKGEIESTPPSTLKINLYATNSWTV